ncbi:hypothetical protein D0T53_07510 [Dysgonomonas sp. 216]|nr:hypothetical protein [Dysgonomonas sp. 216]
MPSRVSFHVKKTAGGAIPLSFENDTLPGTRNTDYIPETKVEPICICAKDQGVDNERQILPNSLKTKILEGERFEILVSLLKIS